MSSDGVNSYTWDRANRLLSMGGVDYQYDGEGRRVQQTVSSTVTRYLLDIQPGLSVVLSETTSSSVVRNVHAPKGIHARKDASSNWHWLMQDGLGSVRAEVSNTIAVEGSQNFAPYGSSVDALGSFGTDGFTGEPTDVNGLVYDRARYYVPSIGMFASLDPFEGIEDEPMTINGYNYVNGNPINLIDPSGNLGEEVALAACIADPLVCAVVVGVAAVVLYLIWSNAGRKIAQLCNTGMCFPHLSQPPEKPPQEYVPVATPLPPLGGVPLTPITRTPVATSPGTPVTPAPVSTSPGTPFPVMTIPPIATPPPVSNVFMNQIRFSDSVENWISIHGLPQGQKPATAIDAQELLNQLAGGLEDRDKVRDRPIMTASQLTPDHIITLLWNQAGHINKTIRGAIAEPNDRHWIGLKGQIALARYRFLADPRLDEAREVEIEALNHPSMPKDKRDELLQTLYETLAKYK